jgi:hypothetical protein
MMSMMTAVMGKRALSVAFPGAAGRNYTTGDA